MSKTPYRVFLESAGVKEVWTDNRDSELIDISVDNIEETIDNLEAVVKFLKDPQPERPHLLNCIKSLKDAKQHLSKAVNV